MTNVETKVEGNTLVIRVDLSKRNGRSKSGKTEIIATTGGNAAIGNKSDRIFLGLNCYQA